MEDGETQIESKMSSLTKENFHSNNYFPQKITMISRQKHCELKSLPSTEKLKLLRTEVAVCYCQLTTALEKHQGRNSCPKGKCTCIKSGRVFSSSEKEGKADWMLVPWVMWRTRLSSHVELDGVPAALAILHQDRHRVLPTRQRARQRRGMFLSHRPFSLATPFS